MATMLIQGGRVIDPANQLDQLLNLVIENGAIAEITTGNPRTDEVIMAQGMIVSPGLVDLHVALRDPGGEEDEGTASGTKAALAGGFTTIAALPDTNPVVDNRASAEFVILQAERAGYCRVVPLGAITRNHQGEELADLGQLAAGGAGGFTDANRAVQSAEIMRRALEYARMLNRPIFAVPQDATLSAGGLMHEGYFSTVLGLRGIPAAAEEIMVGRDIALAELTGGHVHLMNISTRNSVEELKRAKGMGIRVTADVTPHHLAMTDASLVNYDTNLKVLPPLRSQEHVDALMEGLRDGTIDSISSDHRPFASEKKSREFDQVPFGVSSIETALAVVATVLVDGGLLDWPDLLRLLTVNPAKILGIDAGTLDIGRPADLALIDPAAHWIVDTRQFYSRGHNTPFQGKTLRSRVMMTIVGGEVRFSRQ
ncbi:dihydroorotase [Planctopirus hydrillae]|uniref:Dihydroorotase n=1 Tax=Planctopirus hydrillae TaxID=1841610 RepID=A0A1C3E3W4_9PLAN|nr:dihydroorotase [Planctopirus hydrillae]ODA27936.1 dihydroorotase [Planctopirus hydrillae]